MGLKYRIVESTRKEMYRMICDRCGKKSKLASKGQWNPYGKPYSCYHEPSFDGSPEFCIIRFDWGYFSKKDTETHEIVLCEPCYDILFKDVNIKITNYM